MGLGVAVGGVGLPVVVATAGCVADAVGLGVAESGVSVAVVGTTVGVFVAAAVAVADIHGAVSIGDEPPVVVGVMVAVAIVVGVDEGVGVGVEVGVGADVGVGDGWTSCAETRGGVTPKPAIKPSQYPTNRLAIVAAHSSR